ncbi:diaminopimelate epimerase [Blattabacterium cuenoti]|uniref:diaminopimelate epimerase n=1 Tax=Blattabacterium cuenoti TaxID=1653831 RepID=UPI00163C6952|nr:diaminopimelate epimerase [Blattabacterium cuenoti]
MKIDFLKYQGTGNDFIMIDNREKKLTKVNFSCFKRLCNRHFGIGADGIILIQNDPNKDFYMKYYNSDGKESSMCGNGGRCAISFSKKLGITKNNKIYFRAIDGNHYGYIQNKGLVSIKMIDIKKNMIKLCSQHIYLNTGSPHNVIFVDNIKKIDVQKKGREIRLKKGVNVNFVELIGKNILKVRTYERGVENETLSCGTGVTASVIASYELKKIYKDQQVLVYTLGGKLWVSFKKEKNTYQKIYLTGSTKLIFEGWINI